MAARNRSKSAREMHPRKQWRKALEVKKVDISVLQVNVKSLIAVWRAENVWSKGKKKEQA